MHMTFRWYGEGNDTVTLEQIRQIPGVEGIVWALHNKQPGEIWEPDRSILMRRSSVRWRGSLESMRIST